MEIIVFRNYEKMHKRETIDSQQEEMCERRHNTGKDVGHT